MEHRIKIVLRNYKEYLNLKNYFKPLGFHRGIIQMYSKHLKLESPLGVFSKVIVAETAMEHKYKMVVK